MHSRIHKWPSDSDVTFKLAMLLVPRCRSRYLFPLRYVRWCLQLNILNSGVYCLSEWPSDNDVTIKLAMLLVLRCRSRYLFPLRYVCRCIQLNTSVRLADTLSKSSNPVQWYVHSNISTLNSMNKHKSKMHILCVHLSGLERWLSEYCERVL
jgi:hypothetical protein